MEGETLKEWVEREEREKAEKEHETMVLMCNLMYKMDLLGHGVIKWIHPNKTFRVYLERLWKEQINRDILLRMLRCCCEVMLLLIPTFRGVVVDITCEKKYMLENTQGRFTQRRMMDTVIRWFCDGLPNKCHIFIQEKLRDTGVPVQKPFRPSTIVNKHCFGGDELKICFTGKGELADSPLEAG
ncbi:hypothetical protein R1sor_011430 [Riccia sorocarpa]|uniref:Uncharacterized protein n=1 Tax=Riccia sorocarpa TaxID=122646 RepID=A0ABD3I6W9_9MARC